VASEQDDEAVRREPFDRTDGEIKTFLQDFVLKEVDPAVRRFFGLPVYAALLVFPFEDPRITAWASNADPVERDKLARAMLELLIGWGYISG
jgi:hypothetical protein